MVLLATLKDIAAACETSIATVSYVLSGRGEERRISAAMQQKVVDAAEALGYDFASRARKNRRPAVAIFWPQRQMDSMLPSFISGMNTALGMAPISADVIIQPYEPGHVAEQSTLWMPGRMGASVIVSAGTADLVTLKNRKTTYPAVLINRMVPGYPSVSVEENEAGKLAAEYALAHAGDEITLVLPDKWILGVQYRSLSVQETCLRCGVKPRAAYTCGIEIDDGYALGQQLLLEGKLTRAVICVYDTVAIGLAQAIKEAGLMPGRDVELITMSMSYTSSNTRLYQNLTVVDLRQVEVSIRAINMAINLATHAGDEVRQIVVHPLLIPHKQEEGNG